MARVTRWQRYADNMGLWIGEHFNSVMRRTLEKGITTLVENTQHDSSRAASHWVVIPNRGKVNPGAWREMTFNPAFGVPPVGRPGDRGRNAPAAIQHVVGREMRRSVRATIDGRSGQATVFHFSNSTPHDYDDAGGGYLDDDTPRTGNSYRENAKLEQARDAALGRMSAEFNAQMARGNVRKKPLR